jgi:hypothetical protein
MGKMVSSPAEVETAMIPTIDMLDMVSLVTIEQIDLPSRTHGRFPG